MSLPSTISLPKIQNLTQRTKFRSTSSVSLSTATGEPFKLMEDQCVFVCAPDTERGTDEENVNSYWKALVKKIYVGLPESKWPGEVFFVAEWLWHKEDLHGYSWPTRLRQLGIPGCLGENELVRSSSTSVVEAGAVEDEFELADFDDRECFGTPVDGTGWYTRFWGDFKKQTGKIAHVHSSCTCGLAYNPDMDVQRFCGDCSKWYHDCCLAEASTPPVEGKESLAEQILRLPVARGAIHEDASSWQVVGNCRILDEFRRWYEQGYQATDRKMRDREVRKWVKEFAGRDFLKVVLDYEWGSYECPRCHVSI